MFVTENPKRMLSGSLIAAIMAVILVLSTSVVRAEESAVPPGTVITSQNWQQYKQYMPKGMAAMFAGTVYWKFPQDIQFEVGPTVHYAPPKPYLDNTEKYSRQVNIINLPNGGHSITGYVAGLPFPNPTEPLKGWKLLVDNWYTYVPYNLCTAGWYFMFEDRLHNISHDTGILVYRRLSFISDVGSPINDPHAQGVDYAEFLQLITPEQARYTTELTLYYTNPAKAEDQFLFIPSLRRSLRVSSQARCSPLFGSDYTYDDTRTGDFNGGIARFDAAYLGEKDILAFMPEQNDAAFADLNNYYPNLSFPKPALGKWQLRSTWKIDIHRVPSEARGYCYSRRVNYMDKDLYVGVWGDLYDSQGKLWKSTYSPIWNASLPGEGKHMVFGGASTIWDQQAEHLSLTIFENAQDRLMYSQDCSNYHGTDYNNVRKYSSISGLAEILR
jgi:hypothetical protein